MYRDGSGPALPNLCGTPAGSRLRPDSDHRLSVGEPETSARAPDTNPPARQESPDDGAGGLPRD